MPLFPSPKPIETNIPEVTTVYPRELLILCILISDILFYTSPNNDINYFFFVI